MMTDTVVCQMKKRPMVFARFLEKRSFDLFGVHVSNLSTRFFNHDVKPICIIFTGNFQLCVSFFDDFSLSLLLLQLIWESFNAVGISYIFKRDDMMHTYHKD